MNSKLNLAIIQANLVWEDPEQNRQQFQKTIKDIKNLIRGRIWACFFHFGT